MPQLNTMKSKRMRLGYALASLLTVFALPAHADLDCVPTPANPTINFGDDINVWGTYPSVTQARSYRCTRSGNLGRITRLCLYIGNGSAGQALTAGGNYKPRILATGNTGTDNVLAFQIYKNAAKAPGDFWGTFAPNGVHLTLPERNWGTGSFAPFTENADMYFQMEAFASAIKNGTTTLATIPPGIYTTSFAGGATLLKASRVIDGGSIDSDCNAQSGYIEYGSLNQQFPFEVKATVLPKCEMLSPTGTIGDIDFGAQTETAVNLQGSTSFNMRCTRTTPYVIGLKPGNNNANGAGVMLKGSDQVSYQLRKAAGMGAAVWGNTGTAPSTPGNGVTSSGTGFSQTHIIYATVASANAPVGSYEDTVTINVTY